MILLDTSGLLAATDASQPAHEATRQILRDTSERILSPFILAELDCLLTSRVGQEAALLFLDEVERGAYTLDTFGPDDVRVAARVMRQYLDLQLGLADASIVVLARRYRCNDVLTFDDRHFRAVLGPEGKPFRLLPHDAA